MIDTTLQRMFAYSDWANAAVIAAATLDDERLDRPLEIGPRPGSLRRLLLHVLSGESIWLNRWKGQVDNAWPNELAKTPVTQIGDQLVAVAAGREQFFASLDANALERVQTYRDSKGSLFKANLRDMLIQGLVHAAHHRSQAVNAIRQVGGEPPELDYMGHVRMPA